MIRLAYHELMGLLGTGDLHPGGAEASEILLAWLQRETRGMNILEIGAGSGRTTQRLARNGWNVTAIEPASVLYERLQQVKGVRVLQEQLDEHNGNYDAVIAESVLYKLPLDESFAKIRTLMRPGGILAFAEMVWTTNAEPNRARAAHDQTLAAFGLPLASREPLTWEDWRMKLAHAGFTIIEERHLGEGSPGKPTKGPALKQAVAILTHPQLLTDKKRMEQAEQQLRVPKDWLESWACVACAD